MGSTSILVSLGGVQEAKLLYKAFGEERLPSDIMPTNYRFTGQLSQMTDTGLYYYGARWYDPYLNRFLSPDGIVPDQYNPLDWDRYSYTRNNPLRFTDPSGHRPDELGCEVDGCYTEQDLRDIAYFEARQFYVSCQNGGGSGCPNYGEIAAFTIGGLVGAAALPEIAGGLINFASRAAPIACADGDCTNEVGQLTKISQDTWRSSQGLIYGPSGNGNAIQHILQHTKDIPSKAIQGVFTIPRTQILPLLDQAWLEIQNMSSNVITYEAFPKGSSVSFIVNMQQTIGYIAGQLGPTLGYQTTTYLKIVLDGTQVITAFPVLP